MKVLHILSNYRWTERAEPATDLIVAQRAAGVQADLVCGRNRSDREDSIVYRAGRRGVAPLQLTLPKHFAWSSLRSDLAGLRDLDRSGGYDVVHAHMENAWLLSALAFRSMPSPPLRVGSVYDPDGLPATLRTRYMLRGGRTDGVITLSERAKTGLHRPFSDPRQLAVIEPSINVDRFRQPPQPDARRRFGTEGAFAIGMVTAVGRRRRLDIVLEALARVAGDIPEARLLVIGRGKLEEFIEKPARALGIRDRVLLGGYCRDQDLVDAYGAMDLLAYPMHGTDRSCRTVREALTAGVPVTASRVGFLPDLVRDGETGCVVPPDPEALAAAWRRLYRAPDTLRAMAERARTDAARRFDPARQASETLAFYDRLRRMRTGGRS